MFLVGGTAVRLCRDQFWKTDQVVSDEIEQEVSSDAADAAVFDHLLDPDAIVVEIGAGCGFISALCANEMQGPYCVEANPNLIDLLLRDSANWPPLGSPTIAIDILRASF
jgi:16S rRNA A1518/A1519 N6-dimethyltransferase RsmA/KsgA/DIM1 with predicted DNA glycosylase/AP lyase activity